MILPDLNLLLYAYDPHARNRKRAHSWRESTFRGSEIIGLPNEINPGFVRMAIHPRLASDASLAVYAMENRATLCSNDADFARFPGLDWKNPLLRG